MTVSNSDESKRGLASAGRTRRTSGAVGAGGLRGVRPWLWPLLAALPLCGACSGGQATAQAPDPVELLESGEGAGEGEGAAPASSDGVRKGIDALQAQDFEKARQILADAHAADPSDPQVAFYYGVALEGVGDASGAVSAYRKALQLDPKLTEASQNLSAVLLDQEDAQGALEVADAGLGHRPDDPALLANRALALDTLGSADALGAYAKALDKTNDLGLRFNYASALAAAGKREQALGELQKIPTSDAEFASAVATLYYRLQAFDECLGLLDKAVAQKPSADLHVRRGACRQGKGDKAGALEDYRAAVKLDARFAPGHYYLGRLLAEQGKKADARAALERALELGAGTPIAGSAQKALADLK